MIRLSIVLMLFLVMTACETLDSDGESSDKSGNVIRQEWPNGNLRREVPTRNKKKHGTAKEYYESGKIKQEINYMDGLKEGKAVYYFENGKPYRTSHYDSNRLHGVRTLYRDNGNILAEIQYNKGNPCKGLKEYLVDGSLKKKYPRLVFKEINEVLTNELMVLSISVQGEFKKVEFYKGELSKDGCVVPGTPKVIPQKEDELKIYYPLPKGTFIMEEVSIYVKVITNLGNPLILEGKYNLAAENR